MQRRLTKGRTEQLLLYAKCECQTCGEDINKGDVVITVKAASREFEHLDDEAYLIICRKCSNSFSGIHAKKLGDAEMEEGVRIILDRLGLDCVNDPNMKGTPRRIATLYELMCSGLDPNNEPRIKSFPNTDQTDQVVIVEAKFISMCSHHFMPFYGKAYFGYIPGNELIGLSKIRRVVDYFARRPQLQEKMTQEIIEYLDEKIHPKGSMLVIEAKHMCVIAKDIGQMDCQTSTSAIKGVFTEEAPRNEFLKLMANLK
jgi:GTP cyclohydrolase I